MNIFEISGDLLALQNAFDEAETDEDMQAAMDAYEAVYGDAFERKAEGYVMVMKNYDAEAAALEAEAKKMMDRAKADKNKAKRLKTTLFDTMNVLGLKKCNAGLFKLAVQKNGGRPPVIIDDEAQIPDEFFDVVRTVNKGRLLDAYKDGVIVTADGEIVEGAHVGEPGESLRIR